MDLEDILQSRNRQIGECRDLIKSLDNIKDSNKCYELKSLLYRKKELLEELNAENYQDTIKELKIINEKIYISSNIIRNNITKFEEFLKLNPILAKLATKESELKFTDIVRFSIKHQFIITFIFLLIGSFIFGAYFLEIDYFPVLNKESFIYFLFLLSGIGLLYVSLFLFLPIAIQKILSEIFKIEYMKQDKKLFFIILIILISIIFFKIIDMAIISEIIPLLIVILVLGFISYKFLSNIAHFIKILMSVLTIFLLIFIFISFISQFEYISQYKTLIITLIFLLIAVFLMIVSLYETAHIKSILYTTYLLFMLLILILTYPDVIKQLQLGNYTPDVLILDPKAKAIIPSDFPYLNNTLKKPKVLSKIGDEYYIELKTAPNKTLRLSIPKNLVLSEQNEVEEKPKDTKKQSKPEKNISQKISQ